MKKYAAVFPGQGSQYVGMGKELFDKYDSVKRTFAQANEALGFDLAELCFSGDMGELTKTENAQPAILTVSVAMYRVLAEHYSFHPVFMAGHSLGEYSALVCAGALGFEEAVTVVRQRGLYMKEAVAEGEGGMAAVVGADQSIIEKICEKVSSDNALVVIANDNSPVQKIISGHRNAVAKASEELNALGVIVKALNVSGPFHSPLMASASDKLKALLKKCKITPFNVPVISNVTASHYNSEHQIIWGLTQQLTAPVLWEATMQYLKNYGVSIVIEIGPKTVLKKLARDNVPEISNFAFDFAGDIDLLEKIILKRKANIKELDPDMTVITRCMAMAVSTKNTNYNAAEYESGVIIPYNELQKIQDELDKSGSEPTAEQMKKALSYLRLIFKTKGVPASEQTERIQQILDETGHAELAEKD